MLEEFRELVRAGILRVTPENEVLPGTRPPATPGPEKPPQHASSREADVALLDQQLLEWLERRKRLKDELARREQVRQEQAQQEEQARQEAEPAPMEHPSESLLGSLRQRVVDLVARKILESWERSEQGPSAVQTLRDQVIERAAEYLLRNLQRDPE